MVLPWWVLENICAQICCIAAKNALYCTATSLIMQFVPVENFTMNDEMNKNFANVEKMLDPMVKANKLVVANMEKLVNFNMVTMQSYVDMSLEQMKAASEINNPQALQAFWSKQAETANALRQKMMDDAKALADMGNGMKEEFSKLAEENTKEFSKTNK